MDTQEKEMTDLELQSIHITNEIREICVNYTKKNQYQ